MSFSTSCVIKVIAVIVIVLLLSVASYLVYTEPRPCSCPACIQDWDCCTSPESEEEFIPLQTMQLDGRHPVISKARRYRILQELKQKYFESRVENEHGNES